MNLFADPIISHLRAEFPQHTYLRALDHPGEFLGQNPAAIASRVKDHTICGIVVQHDSYFGEDPNSEAQNRDCELAYRELTAKLQWRFNQCLFK